MVIENPVVRWTIIALLALLLLPLLATFVMMLSVPTTGASLTLVTVTAIACVSVSEPSETCTVTL